MQNTEKDFQKKMMVAIDSIIGGRYIGYAVKAEGIAIVIADALMAEDIQNLISKLNRSMIGELPFKELDEHKWKITSSRYRRELSIIEKAPLTRKRCVEERTPLMEIRLYNA